ncbi:sensor histidine kinase [Robertmurraya andreesenii]|uniref:histidine kinase n=1 Tax=Anoxybacillus andreesenii TaxID=1325932 RepID=A0ABT9V1M1_9BACL|nr:sensor histidine kinase [Robertmurraya andreesenii]MDQ0154857.1 OmpR family two-component system bacitracin resistance sensor histidine kinase BceS [Robertmurraya andreesenii]
MIKTFLCERLSWILFILSLHVLFVFVAFLDPAIPIWPVLYMLLLSGVACMIFLIVRYHKESGFYRSLLEWEETLDLTQMIEPNSPFEKIVTESLIRQTENLKQMASEHLTALEQEKDDLLSWIHEVKTPLTTMHLMIDRIEDEKLKEEISYEWLRIHHLLDQQLHQRRIPFIENDLFIEETNVKEILVQEIKSLQSWCMQKGIGFDLELQVTQVLSDAKWLAFILRQILTNAVKYSSSSDILFKSYVRNGRIVLEIKDFGRGIAIQDLPRIFDKGFTSTTYHSDHVATGMGLYLARKAAQSLLIHIEVQSKLNVGTTFSLIFPKRNDFHHITGV